MTSKILKALTIAALFVSSAAFADQSIRISTVNGKQEARFALGDSKCVLVGEVIRCMPMVVASK
jgi:hypothetical protein